MCIAILQKKEIQKEVLKTCFKNNPNGCSYTFYDGNDFRVHKFLEFEEFYASYKETFEKNRNKVFMLHFRIRTCGCDGLVNVHPFKIPNAQAKIILAHNGVLDVHDIDLVLNDTQIFIRDYLSKLPGNWYLDDSICNLIALAIGTSKFIIFYADKNGFGYRIINEDLGHWNGGNWYSNFSLHTKAAKNVIWNQLKAPKKYYKEIYWNCINYCNGNDWDLRCAECGELLYLDSEIESGYCDICKDRISS